MGMKRRQFLKWAGGAAVAGTVASGTAAAAHWDAKPKSVNLTFNEDLETLEEYKPYLVTSHLQYEPNALYAWHAENPDYSTNMCVYWAVYDVQNGILPFSASNPLSDSHRGDHEPVVVEYDKATGDVVGVYYSAYHWLKGVAFPADGLSLDGTRPLLSVVKPWHQTRLTTKKGSDVELESLLAPTETVDGTEYDTTFDKWLMHDRMEEVLGIGTTVNPWTMGYGGRPSWWQTKQGFSMNQIFVSMAYEMSQLPGLDLGGFSKSDSVVRQP